MFGDVKVEIFLTDDETSLKTALSGSSPAFLRVACQQERANRGIEAVESEKRLGRRKYTNKEKRKEFMTKWEEASYELHSILFK